MSPEIIEEVVATVWADESYVHRLDYQECMHKAAIFIRRAEAKYAAAEKIAELWALRDAEDLYRNHLAQGDGLTWEECLRRAKYAVWEHKYLAGESAASKVMYGISQAYTSFAMAVR